MFAQRVAQAPTKSPQNSSNKLALQRSTLPTRPSEAASKPAWSFSNVPLYPPERANDGSVSPSSGKAAGELTDEPITGNGGPDAGTKPAAPPTASPASPPKLTKKSKPATASDCGGFKWVVQWELDKVTTKGGWVVQKVEVPNAVKDCDGKAIDLETTGGLRPSWYPLWEAWQINRGQKVTTYAETGDTADDTYGSIGYGAKSKGSFTVKGTPEFYDGLSLPSEFKVTNKAPAWILPSTMTAPTLTGGTGPISHSLTATWDCCGADKTTKIATT
jgi:hypothetical protein